MHEHPTAERGGHYLRLAAMIVLSFISMYILMYAMVDRPANIHPSLNQAYMAALMTAPMVVLELLLMGMMYKRRSLNLAVLVASVVVGLLSFLAIRQQFLVSDTEFLRSMIPHHSGAILMCRRAQLRDPEIQSLCRSILRGQQQEIEQMDRLLTRGR